MQAVTRHDDHVLVKPQGGQAERFDEVVLATHSDQALTLLADASDREHEVLGAIPYQPNEAVLHTDARMLPRRRRAWASWNYHLLPEPKPVTTVTYHMNRLQSLRAEQEFCVTLNHSETIDPARIIRRISYAHPVYTEAGVRAQARVHEIDGRNRTHFCGAYWGWGFHEDGVVSALRVGERFGATAVSSSCIYEGVIRHRRLEPRREFRHRLALAYLDLEELPRLLGGRLVSPRPGLVRFRRRDYLGDPAVPLDRAVRELVSERTGERAGGSDPPADTPALVRALLQPGQLLLLLRPGRRALAGGGCGGDEHALGRAACLRPRAGHASGGVLNAQFEKAMHVSPFMGMDHRYDVRASTPGRTLSVHIGSSRARDHRL